MNVRHIHLCNFPFVFVFVFIFKIFCFSDFPTLKTIVFFFLKPSFYCELLYFYFYFYFIFFCLLILLLLRNSERNF